MTDNPEYCLAQLTGQVSGEALCPVLSIPADERPVRTIHELGGSSFKSCTECILGLAIEKDRLHDMAYVDEETGLPNRNALKEKAESMIQIGKPFLFMTFDLSKFKLYNDWHGHHKGDEVIRLFGHILKAQTRDEEAEAYRLGGDEFALIVESDENELAAQFITERVRGAFLTENLVASHNSIVRRKVNEKELSVDSPQETLELDIHVGKYYYDDDERVLGLDELIELAPYKKLKSFERRRDLISKVGGVGTDVFKTFTRRRSDT